MALTKTPVILTHFEDLRDPRVERTKRHHLSDLVAIALCGAICGADTWADVERFGNEKIAWFRTFLRLENGVPSHDTFGRVFAALDTGQFYACLANWIASLQLDLRGQTVAIDGKTLRKSFDKAVGREALHVVNAWASELRLSIGQLATEEKSNEITAVPRLLEMLAIEGAVVTLDAMHCQKETARAIRSRGTDYVLQVKANQPTLHDQLQALFTEYGDNNWEGVKRHATSDQGHGRVERREYYVVKAQPHLRSQWTDVGSVGMVYRCRKTGGKESHEVSYFPQQLAGQSADARRACSQSLGRREFPALVARGNFFRGSEPDSQGPRARNRQRISSPRPLDSQAGHHPQRDTPRQTTSRRVE